MLNLPVVTRITLAAAVLCAGGTAAAGVWITGDVAARDIAVHTARVDAGDSVVKLAKRIRRGARGATTRRRHLCPSDVLRRRGHSIQVACQATGETDPLPTLKLTPLI
jgi:hypothetical protein